MAPPQQQVPTLATQLRCGGRGETAAARERRATALYTSTPFIVVYRVRSRNARVEILRVLHGKQQWP